ncbi:MAG: DUF2388 domain-containing protein [Betaproteobacteria bacterium]|nr:DUF2388 domain-containing protein [Betaproteobacteria bacterium]
MPRHLPLLLATTLLTAGTASAASFTGTTDMVVGGVTNTVDATSDMTSSLRDDKLVVEAREDAARFVASQGEQRGAWLRICTRAASSRAPALTGSDLELAEAILAR